MDSTTEPVTQLATRIPRELHRKMKLYCVARDVSVMAFVIEALEAGMSRAAGRKSKASGKAKKKVV